MAGRSIGAVLARSQGAAAQWWMAAGVTHVAVYAPKGAASLAASYTNLANPGTYDATPGVAPTWDADRGWIGSAAWHLLTGIIVANTAWSFLVRYANGPTSGATFPTVLSTYNGNSQCIWLAPRNSSGNRRYGNGGLFDSSGGSTTSGVIAAAGNAAYHNGSNIGTIAAGTPPTAQVTIGSLNINGTVQMGATYFWPGDIIAIAIYNTTLSAAQVAAVTAAMQAL